MDIHHVTVKSCTRQPNEVHLKLRFLNEEASFPHCDKLSSELNQKHPVLLWNLAVFSQATYLKVPRRQLYCQGCQRYFIESLIFTDEGRQYTRRYEEHIYQQVQLSSIEQVSRAEGLTAEGLTFERIQGIFKHQYIQKKTLDGKGSNELELTR